MNSYRYIICPVLTFHYAFTSQYGEGGGVEPLSLKKTSWDLSLLCKS